MQHKAPCPFVNGGQHVWGGTRKARSISLVSSRPWLPGAAEGEAEVPAALSAQLCSYLTIIMVFICHLREENPAVCKQGICSTGCFCLALSIVLHNTVCGSYAAHPGGFAVVLATVDPRATRDREQVPPLSELLQLSLKQGGCMGMWAGTWASRLCQVCCLSVPRGEEVSAGWAGRWWVSRCENWDEVSLLLWGSFYLEMHVSMHLKIS